MNKAVYPLHVYADEKGRLLGDLCAYYSEDDLLLGLHEAAHAASGSDTLDMVYTRSEVGKVNIYGTKTHTSHRLRCMGTTCKQSSSLSQTMRGGLTFQVS